MDSSVDKFLFECADIAEAARQAAASDAEKISKAVEEHHKTEPHLAAIIHCKVLGITQHLIGGQEFFVARSIVVFHRSAWNARNTTIEGCISVGGDVLVRAGEDFAVVEPSKVILAEEEEDYE